MTGSSNWARIREVFGRALDLEASQRDDYLREASEGDEAMLAELRSMLERHAALPSDFLAPPEIDEGGGGDALVGQRFGDDFVLLRELGRGSMGVVFEARQESLERKVALKVLREGLLTSATQIERFHREAKAVAKLQHLGVVRIFADGKAERTHWFAMELVDGHDLDADLRKQRDDPQAALLPTHADGGWIRAAARVVAEIADALEHAHTHGLVHRDVKPSNILLTVDGRALLADFGIARDESLGKLTQTGFELGSLFYMSPEQARLIESPVDHRTDVYSLGVVLYERLARRRPYGGRTQPEVLAAIRRGEARSLRALDRSISRELATICAKAMHRDADRRYATAAAFGGDLRRFLRGEAVLAKPPSIAERAARSIRAHRYLLALAVIITLSALGYCLQRDAHLTQTSARLSVRFDDSRSQRQVRGEVFVRVLDQRHGDPLRASLVGELPLVEARVKAGHVRVVVVLEDGEQREFVRELGAGQHVRIVHAFGARVGSPMLEFEAATPRYIPLPAPPSADPVVDDDPRQLEAFAIDRFEVSNAQWRRFLLSRDEDDRAAATPSYWDVVVPGSERDRWPVTDIAWEHARDYAEWAGKRLPTLREWVWAARNAKAWTRYPWADGAWPAELDPMPSATPKTVDEYWEQLLPVDSAPAAATARGLHRMFGNAQEWVETAVLVESEEQLRVDLMIRYTLGLALSVPTRGGPLGTDLAWSAIRGVGPANRKLCQGFRCARSLAR